MAIQGEQTLSGIELENSYVHITRVQCAKFYQEVDDNWDKLYTIDYDFGVFKSKDQFQVEPNNPIKKYFRIRFQVKIYETSITDVWELAYENLKNQLTFREFTNI